MYHTIYGLLIEPEVILAQIRSAVLKGTFSVTVEMFKAAVRVKDVIGLTKSEVLNKEQVPVEAAVAEKVKATIYALVGI